MNTRNRNPTINYGSLLQMFCVGMNKDLDHDYTMSLPLQILPLLAADSTYGSQDHCYRNIAVKSS